jgi:hypothetical protein
MKRRNLVFAIGFLVYILGFLFLWLNRLNLGPICLISGLITFAVAILMEEEKKPDRVPQKKKRKPK